jgi:hypothetical protein
MMVFLHCPHQQILTHILFLLVSIHTNSGVTASELTGPWTSAMKISWTGHDWTRISVIKYHIARGMYLAVLETAMP